MNSGNKETESMPAIPDFSDKKILEKYSSAITLSDMEIFVFPELFYPLVIANIMSPLIWKWREEEWFKDIHKKSFNYKINRIKQYIMDHYVFNLDLETWGLTRKDKEMDRFKDYIDSDVLSKSNALFGYEGDKYYFDIDIRRHFGLDKYTSDIIPYWKTETVEAMTAFKYRKSFDRGAGECVSLSALYAAALFIVGEIPLENIYLMGTPLHSQNFIDVSEGVLTNNRRIVTKKMWYNGTAISTMARRALEHEKVTVVSHISGYIHHLYKSATIDKNSYLSFREKLSAFLESPLSAELFINFLRYHMKFKKLFQFRHFMKSHDYYIPLETVFEYEHSAKYILAPESIDALLSEIDDEEFSLTPLKERIILQDVLECIERSNGSSIDELRDYCWQMACTTQKITEDKINTFIWDLKAFLKVDPRLPDINKEFTVSPVLNIGINQTRNQIIDLINNSAGENELALLSIYAYRDMELADWKPFIKAALERNPVSLEGLKGKNAGEAFETISSLPNESVYDSKRLAQPDEVWNFGRGDGVEKAFLMANFLLNDRTDKGFGVGDTGSELLLDVQKEKVNLISGDKVYLFHSQKEIIKKIDLTDLFR